MPPRLPGLNYGTPLTIDDLSYLEAVYTGEFRNRTLAVLGNYRTAGPAYGVLTAADPTNAAATTDPFYVARDANDEMTANVYPGVCYSQSGMRIELAATAEQVEMARTTIGAQNVLYVEHVVISDADTVTKTRYNTSEARRTRIADETSADPLDQTVLQVASLADWQDSATYPPDRQANIVVLAIATVVAADNPAGKRVDIDLSRTNFSVNRPWFSPVDIGHRSFIGTGSTDTPHNLGLNDLSQGDLSLYDQLLNYGMIIGRDRDAPGVPGSLCIETITPARLKTDTTGTVTGTLSQSYVELTRYPVRLLGAYSLPNPVNEICVRLMPRTNILLVHHDDVVPPSGMRLLYTTVSAAEPLPNSLVNDELHVRQPTTAYELVIAGGRGHTIIQPRFLDPFTNERARISLGTAPGIPKQYRVHVDGDGALLSTPQHIMCATKLDDLGTAVFQFETEMLGAARLRVGLQNVDLNAATNVQLRLTGSDNSGNTITEDLTFTFSNYSSPVIGSCQEDYRNYQVTQNVFTAAVSVQVIDRTADGPNTAACVIADLDPMQTEALRDVCPIADVMWDGARICRVQDARPISSRLEVPSRTTAMQLVAQGLMAVVSATNTTATAELLSDDLRDPHWFRLDDPLRFWKFSDGLETTRLPLQPGVESASLGLTQDRYVSHALRLLPAAGRSVHVTLFGKDAQRYLMNATDGLLPNVEYRWATTVTPETWTSWTPATPLAYASGANFRIPITDDEAFKFQLRVKGAVAGIAAVQYAQLGGSQSYSGVREYTAGFSASQTHKVALPFGQTLPSTDYRVHVNAYTDTEVLGSGAAGLDVIHVERYLDHAVAHLTSSTTIASTTWRVAWSIDLSLYEATTDEGFGDTVS